MRLETTGFKEGRKNTRFKCGMFDSPYMTSNQCRRLATSIVTDESFLTYRAYWSRWNRSHEEYNRLPMMHLRIICDEHRDQIRNLPDNPRGTVFRYRERSM